MTFSSWSPPVSDAHAYTRCHCPLPVCGESTQIVSSIRQIPFIAILMALGAVASPVTDSLRERIISNDDDALPTLLARAEKNYISKSNILLNLNYNFFDICPLLSVRLWQTNDGFPTTRPHQDSQWNMNSAGHITFSISKFHSKRRHPTGQGNPTYCSLPVPSRNA